MKFGEYLTQQKAITPDQIEEALVIQDTSPELKLGEILVSKGFLGNQELLEWIDRFMEATGNKVAEVTEWLTQEEIDALVDKLRHEEN